VPGAVNRVDAHVEKCDAREYETYIRDLDKDHGHDPGLIFARDLTKQVEKYHGRGSDLAKQFVTLLADRPDLQRQYLGGEIPKAPPIGIFKPGGEDGVKNFIDQDRAANGLAPRYAIPAVSRGGAEDVTLQRMSARGLPEPEAHNLLQLTQEMQGTPEDQAFNPIPTPPPRPPAPQPPGAVIVPIPQPVPPTTTESGPAGPASGPAFIEGIITERRPRGPAAQTEVYPPPPTPVPRRPNERPAPGPDDHWQDPNQMAPLHKPEPRQPEPNWNAMSDEELEAAEEEAEYRVRTLEQTDEVVAGRLRKAEEDHDTENKK
jgi:hypothetical protein